MKLLWQSVGHKFSEARSACYLLDWSGEIVAEGHWSSSDPNIMVHGIPLGAKFMRVWEKLLVQQLRGLPKKLLQEVAYI